MTAPSPSGHDSACSCVIFVNPSAFLPSMSALLRYFRFPLRSRSARYQHPCTPPRTSVRARQLWQTPIIKNVFFSFLLDLLAFSTVYHICIIFSSIKKEPLHHILCDREVRSPYLSSINSVQNILTVTKTILRQISACPILRHLQCVLPLLYICNSFSNIPVPLFHWLPGLSLVSQSINCDFYHIVA